jgi:hypothetical protein
MSATFGIFGGASHAVMYLRQPFRMLGGTEASHIRECQIRDYESSICELLLQTPRSLQSKRTAEITHLIGHVLSDDDYEFAGSTISSKFHHPLRGQAISI